MACIVSAYVAHSGNQSRPTALVYIDAMGERQHIQNSQDSLHAAATRRSRPSHEHILTKSASNNENSVDAPILDALREHEEMEQVSERLLHLKQGMEKPPKVYVWHDKKVIFCALHPINRLFRMDAWLKVTL
jgi:hypothetical protein